MPPLEAIGAYLLVLGFLINQVDAYRCWRHDG